MAVDCAGDDAEGGSTVAMVRLLRPSGGVKLV